MKRKAVIAIYSHIEAYPPSLNALYHLATVYDEVHVLMRNVMVSNWIYPKNVIIIPHGEFIDAEKMPYLSLLKKLKSFLAFGFKFRKVIKQEHPSLVLNYDAPAFVLFNLFCIGRGRKIINWYHNHDVMHEAELPRYSLMWLIRRAELRYFSRCTYFSLPNKVRLVYFPIDRLIHPPIILPNYPSKFFYGKWNAMSPKDGGVIRVLFQGHISKSNGIEEFLAVLPFAVLGKEIELHLAGPINTSFKESLLKTAAELGVAHRLFFYGRLPYSKLPDLTASCHIGVAIYGSHNTMVRTMSTASNKLFEYASVGLPVIVNKRQDLEDEFSNYQWIHFTELEIGALHKTIIRIAENYDHYSFQCKCDFNEKLNFEDSFLPFVKVLST